MKTFKITVIIAISLMSKAVFCQSNADKVAAIVKGINVYFPGSEVQSSAHKLNLNVQGRIVAVPLCHVDIAKVDDHNFSFTAKDKNEKLMRGDQVTTSVNLQLVHSSNEKILELLRSLQSTECGK